jgi:hypothetical protein
LQTSENLAKYEVKNMKAGQATPKTIDKYIASFPKDVQEKFGKRKSKG